MTPAVATVLGALVGGGVAVIVAVVNAVVGRRGRRADVADKITESSERIMDRLDREIAKVEEKCQKCENRLSVAQRTLEQVETDNRRLKTTVRTLIRVLDANDPTQVEAAINAARELL